MTAQPTAGLRCRNCKAAVVIQREPVDVGVGTITAATITHTGGETDCDLPAGFAGLPPPQAELPPPRWQP